MRLDQWLRTYMTAHTRTHTHTHAHTHTHTHTHTRTHTLYVQNTCIHTYIHTYVCTPQTARTDIIQAYIRIYVHRCGMLQRPNKLTIPFVHRQLPAGTCQPPPWETENPQQRLIHWVPPTSCQAITRNYYSALQWNLSTVSTIEIPLYMHVRSTYAGMHTEM